MSFYDASQLPVEKNTLLKNPDNHKVKKEEKKFISAAQHPNPEGIIVHKKQTVKKKKIA